MILKRYYILLIFALAVFALALPTVSSAWETYYTTECGETITTGTCWEACCARAKDGSCISSCIQCSCSASWDEYRVEKIECGTTIQVRRCQSVCGQASACCNCGPCQVICDSPQTYKKCENWQKAKRDSCEVTEWGKVAPVCKCEGECLETPKNPRYYDNPNYSDQANKNVGNTNISLPVKLDWDDVAGWKKVEGPQSYVINIKNTSSTFPQVISKSEFIPKSCSLKSHRTHLWSAKACCKADGTNCGSESSWSLTTNYAPELVSPYDPDWTGSTSTKNVALPVTLDWCDVNEAQSYRFKVYIIEGGKNICHPDLLSTNEGKEFCDSWLLRKTRRDPEQIEKALYSDFFDENMDFFTKNTTSSWEVAICDENGLDCKDYSQIWTFGTKDMSLAVSFLVSPTDDPAGETPVGLPLILDWNDKPGVNSFIYEVALATGGQKISGSTNVSQSKSFDYPELSLNTLYKWKVKSCWDYEAKSCEPNFSEEWYFKTTGQPPKLIQPTPGAANVVIPVNFNWEDVSGAKSYVFKVSGSELNLEKILDEPEFSLDFPDYPIHQETNYSWQVKTCAWEEGKTCGQYGNAQTFKTFRLPPPQNPSPKNNGQFFTDDKYVSWEKITGAKAYQYQIKYLSLAEKEIDETCSVLVGKEIVPQKIVGSQNDYLSLLCLGEYQWQVRSCLDENCQEVSNWSNLWSFTLLEGGTGQNGLVPCGRSTDNPNTPWNEREPCQIKHLFLSVKIIVDFLLFRVAPIILVLLTIITAIMFFTSFGQIITMAKVISLWKATGIGLIIIFFAWTIVNIFLKLVGYNIGVFGNWYELPI